MRPCPDRCWSLPDTGFAVEPWLAWGFGLLLMGGLLVYGGRRRRGLHG